MSKEKEKTSDENVISLEVQKEIWEQIAKSTHNHGGKEIIILTGAAEPVYHDKGLEVKDASIFAVHEYLSKDCVDPEEIKNSKIEFSVNGLYMNLFYSNRRRNPDVIKGVLKLHPDLKKFNINSDKRYNTFELSDFIKMNRHYFENKEYAMALVSKLREFEGKVNKEVELKADNRANSKVLINQVVESNIPSGFFLQVPVFVGEEKVRLEVEININSAFECSLISPDLKMLIDEETKNIIGDQLNLIRALWPQLRIFEL